MRAANACEQDLHLLARLQRPANGLACPVRVLVVQGEQDAIVHAASAQAVDRAAAEAAADLHSAAELGPRPDHTNGARSGAAMAGGPDDEPDQVLEAFGRAAPRYATRGPTAAGHGLAAGPTEPSLYHPAGLWVDPRQRHRPARRCPRTAHPGQQVIRLDGSAAMLNSQPHGTHTLLHDLSRGCPNWSSAPATAGLQLCFALVE